MPAPAWVVLHMTQQDHKYFRKKEKNHLSRGINSDVNICSFSDCFTVYAVKNICPVNCSKFHLLTGITRKQRFTHSCCLQCPVPWCPVPCGSGETQSFVSFQCLGAPFVAVQLLWYQVWWFGLI